MRDWSAPGLVAAGGNAAGLTRVVIVTEPRRRSGSPQPRAPRLLKPPAPPAVPRVQPSVTVAPRTKKRRHARGAPGGSRFWPGWPELCLEPGRTVTWRGPAASISPPAHRRWPGRARATGNPVGRPAGVMTSGYRLAWWCCRACACHCLPVQAAISDVGIRDRTSGSDVAHRHAPVADDDGRRDRRRHLATELTDNGGKPAKVPLAETPSRL
jgi:hypothetical protein